MICEICGNDGARLRHVSRSYGKGDSLLVIENVPVISCPHCGESYMSAATVHALDEIRSNRAAFAQQRAVAVASF